MQVNKEIPTQDLTFDDVHLSPVTLSDLEDIRQWRTHPEVTKYMYTDPKLSPEDQLNWYQKVVVPGFEKGSDYYFIIFHQHIPVGLVSITDIDKNRGAFWAFYLSPNTPRGQGIGSKVEYIVLRFVFESLRLHKIRCEVLSTNEKVVKMHEKFGFKQEGYFKKFIIKNGVPLDVVSLGLLKEEWDASKDATYARLVSRND